MSDKHDDYRVDREQDSRRSFVKKGALASTALALGGSAIGTAAAQEDGGQVTPADGGGDGAGDTVLMLYPDAVEGADVTVASAEIDWLPFEDGAAGTPTPGGEGTPTPGAEGTPTETPVGGEETPTPATGGGGYRTHIVEYGFSASHVAPVFVPDGVDVRQDEQYQLGQIEEILDQPDQAGTTAGGDQADGLTGEGQPLFVRVGFETGGDVEAPVEEGPEETPTEAEPGATPAEPEATPTEGGGVAPETPTPTEEDGGLF